MLSSLLVLPDGIAGIDAMVGQNLVELRRVDVAFNAEGGDVLSEILYIEVSRREGNSLVLQVEYLVNSSALSGIELAPDGW